MSARCIGLAPCPFCGSDNVRIWSTPQDLHGGLCDGCGAHAPWSITKDNAIAIWNQRRFLPPRLRHDGPPPVLPVELLHLIGEYGMARTDGVSQLEVQHRWECLIRGIKAYAVGIPRAGAGVGLRQGMGTVPSPDARISATATTISRLLLGDARKVDCDIIESHIRELLDERGIDSGRPAGSHNGGERKA